LPNIGNDIVSLNGLGVRQKSANIRFLNRVFTPNEQRLIRCSDEPDRVLWSLWAAKETAYKVLSKKYENITSAPLRYEITPAVGDSATSYPFDSGAVAAPGDRVLFRLVSGEDFVHCIGTDAAECLDSIRWGVRRLDIRDRSEENPAYESRMVRQAAAEGIASFFDMDPQDVDIQRSRQRERSNPPVAYLQGNQMPGDLSLSHDCPFVAFAFIAKKAPPAADQDPTEM
jgi:hypothetical protein